MILAYLLSDEGFHLLACSCLGKVNSGQSPELIYHISLLSHSQLGL